MVIGVFSLRAVLRNESWMFCAGLFSMPISFFASLMPSTCPLDAGGRVRGNDETRVARLSRGCPALNNVCTIRPPSNIFNPKLAARFIYNFGTGTASGCLCSKLLQPVGPDCGQH